jgi:hypothetical protein
LNGQFERYFIFLSRRGFLAQRLPKQFYLLDFGTKFELNSPDLNRKPLTSEEFFSLIFNRTPKRN